MQQDGQNVSNNILLKCNKLEERRTLAQNLCISWVIGHRMADMWLFSVEFIYITVIYLLNLFIIIFLTCHTFFTIVYEKAQIYFQFPGCILMHGFNGCIFTVD